MRAGCGCGRGICGGGGNADEALVHEQAGRSLQPLLSDHRHAGTAQGRDGVRAAAGGSRAASSEEPGTRPLVSACNGMSSADGNRLLVTRAPLAARLPPRRLLPTPKEAVAAEPVEHSTSL